MSALEMTANGGKMSTGVARLIEDAISELHEVTKIIRDLQLNLGLPGAPHTGAHLVVDKTALWHRLESIDDRIHNALAKLGE